MESTTPRTRRNVLAATAAAAAAVIADRLASPAGVQAVSSPMLTETINTATAETALYCSNGAGFGGFAQNTGPGVWGATNDPNNAGLYGLAYNANGTGVVAKNSHPEGNGLQVLGKARFARSGRATVHAGNSTVDVIVPGGLSGTPLLFANMQQFRSGVAVAAIRPNYPTAGKARIYLTKSVSSNTYVAWWVAA